MRLAALISELADDQLERLEAEHLREGEPASREALCATLETVLRSYSFVKRFVGDRLPPTFTILEILLDSPDYSVAASGFRELVEERTRSIVDRVTSGDLIGRDSSLRIYRRVLFEARRNDLVLDSSETALLGVLRQELGVRTAEHFLLEHHPEFHHFWSTHAFLDQMNALRSCGLIFGHEGRIFLAEETVPLVRRVLGFEMALDCRRRLYEQLTGADFVEALAACSLKTSGSREERLARLEQNYIQPSEVLRSLSLQRLRDVCRDSKASVSGTKEDVLDRLVDHFLCSLDIKAPSPPPPPVVPEARILDEMRFKALFNSLKGDDLTDILAGFDSSRLTGR